MLVGLCVLHVVVLKHHQHRCGAHQVDGVAMGVVTGFIWAELALAHQALLHRTFKSMVKGDRRGHQQRHPEEAGPDGWAALAVEGDVEAL